MLENGGNVRDQVKISDLPEDQQKIWQARAMHVVIAQLAFLLKDKVGAHVADKTVRRSLNPAEMTEGMSESMKGIAPTPAEIKGIIPAVDWWFDPSSSQMVPSNLEEIQRKMRVWELASRMSDELMGVTQQPSQSP